MPAACQPSLARVCARLALLLLGCVVAWPVAADDAPPGAAELRGAVESMKRNPRGPFARIRWFCADGTVLPPEPFACADHGGGRQHGEWSATTRRIRDAGYPIGNVYSALTPEDFGGDGWRRLLPFLLIEQYLVDADDGWILRGARYHRGALQAEGEAAAAERILQALAAEPDWIGDRLPLLVEAVRLFPTETESVSAGQVRALATAIHAAAPEFAELRNKLHNRLESGDAAAVRAFAQRPQTGAAAADLAALAESIDALFRTPPPALLIRSVTPLGPTGVRLREIADDFGMAGPRVSIGLRADAMAELRDSLVFQQTPAARVRAIRAILALEAGMFALVSEVLAEGEREAPSRLAQLGLMASLARAGYGLGLLTSWERSHFDRVLRELDIEPTVDEWREAVGYFERLPGWALRRLAFYFELPQSEFARLEPRALEYLPDRLRGSPLFGYARAVEALAHDAAVLAGVRHEFLGERFTVGFRALNPGLARGVVRTPEDLAGAAGEPVPAPRDSIVVVPETIAELPAVAGILTENEGNALSHVQLLARNLGVPNVVVGPELMPRLLEQRGRRIELAVSPGGLVRITALEADPGPDVRPPDALRTIVPDLAKLDLDTRRVLSTRELGARDSGVRVGPKAAQVGELAAVFPDRVSPGLAIPFGVYREFLAQPRVPGDADSITAFDWLRRRYAELDAMADASRRAEETRVFLAEVRDWIAQAPLEPLFVARLREALQREFGPDGSYGVFVRSDTNVEDLPGFTGAGLNLTVPHVVGFDNILAALRAVWASPFTERAFGWRQALMDSPEHVYASVLLHLSVSNDRSGVLVTADVATGERGFLSVATHEGVGGGVEGQSAEMLRIRVGPERGAAQDVRLLSSVTAPLKQVLADAGGSALVPASGRDRVLSDADIAALVALSRELPGWFADLPAAAREATIADVEFGFRGNRLMLFQIRPFVENRAAERVVMLQAMDRALRDVGGERISLAEPTR